MKVRLLFALLLFSLMSFAQDDYCSCMETDNYFERQSNYEELFTSLSQYKEELSYWSSQTTTITRTKIVIPPEEQVTLVLVEEAFLEEKAIEEAKEEIEATEATDLANNAEEIKNEVEDQEFEQVLIKTERSKREKSISGKGRLVSAKVKKKKKRLKGKLKRRKRTRKYKGACPNF